MTKLRMTVVGIMVFSSLLIVQNTARAVTKQPKHLVPADKKLSPDKMKQLFERGRQQYYRGKDLDTIGMPVGGIGTGQLYLRGDGTFAVWQIFNRHVFSGYGAENYRAFRPDSPVDSGFAIVVKKEGETSAKTLDRDFGTVEFAGEYPLAIVRYADDASPVKVRMACSSPFIPLNAQDSALPATMLNIVVENVSDVNITVGIVGWLENAVLNDSARAVHALRRSRIVNEKERKLIVHTAEKAPIPEGAAKPRPKIVLANFEGPDYGKWEVAGEAFGKAPANGTLAGQQQVSGFGGKGLVNTFLGGDGPVGALTSPSFEISRKFINFLIGGGGHAGQTCINLVVNGKIVRTATGKNNEKLEWYFWNVQEFDGMEAKIQIVDKHSGAWGHINIDQIELSDEPQKGPVGPIENLPDYGSMVLALLEDGASPQETRDLFKAVGSRDIKLHAEQEISYPATERRSASVASSTIELKPRGRHAFRFVLAWFFPNHTHGHEYTGRFDSAAQVAH
ncbi:MAG: GH116 family glycosyl-hydrolase, partial [Planctomycetota bacterium]